MPTSQAILNDVDLRYRNTFTTAQKLVWFNEEQRELFDILEIDSPPYAFTTVEGENYYPFPTDFDISKIKVVTYQINDADEPDFTEIPMVRNDDNQYAPYSGIWYSVISNSFYLYVPEGSVNDRTVYVYCDSDPTEVTTENISSSPDLPTKYQEILKLGILKRIAMARKDTEMFAFYNSDYQDKVGEIAWEKRLKEPEFNSAVDMLPSTRRNRTWPRGTVAITVSSS